MIYIYIILDRTKRGLCLFDCYKFQYLHDKVIQQAFQDKFQPNLCLLPDTKYWYFASMLLQELKQNKRSSRSTNVTKHLKRLFFSFAQTCRFFLYWVLPVRKLPVQYRLATVLEFTVLESCLEHRFRHMNGRPTGSTSTLPSLFLSRIKCNQEIVFKNKLKYN